MRRSVVALVSLVVMGCAAVPPMIEEPVEKERIFKSDFDQVWERAIEVLAEGGNKIVHSEKTSGLIVYERDLSRGELYQFAFVSAYAGSIVGGTASTTLLIKPAERNSTRVTVNATFKASLMGFDEYGRGFVLTKPLRTRGVLEKTVLDMIETALPGGAEYEWMKEKAKGTPAKTDG